MWWEKHVRRPGYKVVMVIATIWALPTGPVGWVVIAIGWWWYLSLIKRNEDFTSRD